MKRKILPITLLGIMLIATFSFCLCSTLASSEKTTIIVPDDFGTIKDAVDAAKDGDTILVKAGIYNEEWISVDKSISLVGEKKRSIINYQSGTGLILSADNIEIREFSITNSESQNGYAINLLGVDNCVIQDNLIENNLVGISVIGYSSGNSILENILNQNNRSVELINSNNNIITKNNITGALVSGISLDGSSGNIISKNNISDLVNGIGSLMLWQSSNNTVFRNLLFGGNLFLMVNCSQNTFSENFVMDSNYGVLVGDSSNNIFYKNYFINIKENPVNDQANIPDFFSDNIRDNGFEGNYWSDYDGEDHDNDNIGDSVFFLYEENIDNFPLMNYPKISINSENITEETDSSSETFTITLEVTLGFLTSIIIIVIILFILRQKKK